MSKLRSQQRVVLAVMLSGIVVILLEDKKIAYSQFKILLDAKANLRYKITKRSNFRNLLQCTKLIF